jgi:hypothetical protein
MQAVPLQAKALRGERRAAWTSICLTMTRRGVPNSFRGCGCAEMGCAGRAFAATHKLFMDISR